MTIRIGINGFGRIGRNIMRAQRKDPAFKDIEIVAINDLAPKASLAHLLKYDSVMGTMEGEVVETEKGFSIDGKEVIVCVERDPAKLPWGEMGVDYVVESTGLFRKPETAGAHIKGGAKKVIISAPASGDISTFVMGVNEEDYDPAKDDIVSNASCTTNCLAPFAKVIQQEFGIVRGLMTTIHAYTNDQALLDMPHSDLRRARSAALSMIPTKTGAAAAIGLVMPELKGRFDGLAVRVPTPNVSIVDAVMEVEKECTAEEINAALKAATSRYLGYFDAPLVSIDMQGDPRSSIVDGGTTRANGKMIKVMSWYDNEWGYSNRVLDLLLHMVAKG
uniref:Glyceraldehyde-3-phosphate dehydrogenase n=1 Tax=Magnetococcus massalia (strain MO-1) TaxID=451514 RepID=A0A1S7LM23_MAGMO|nr:Glyceraldehyde-3-phosphate dehydrogenase (GAPDH) [Candidatus Magnetococcus massalia]